MTFTRRKYIRLKCRNICWWSCSWTADAIICAKVRWNAYPDVMKTALEVLITRKNIVGKLELSLMFRILEIWSWELLSTSFLFFVFPLMQGASMIDKQVTYAAGDEQTAEGPLTPLILHTQEESSSTSSTHICRPDGSSDSSDSRKIKQSKVRFGHNIAFAEDEDVERSPRCSEAGGRSMAKRALYKRLLSNPKDELRHFRSGLLWLGLDQSSPTKVVLSWIVFFLFTLVVPVFNYNFVSCSECGEEHAHPFEKMVQVSETALAAVSFLCLSSIVRQYGLRRTLLLDKIIKESHDVRLGYEQELRVSSLSLSLSPHAHNAMYLSPIPEAFDWFVHWFHKRSGAVVMELCRAPSRYWHGFFCPASW